MEPAPAAAAEGQTWWPSDESIAAWGRWSTPAGMEPYPPLVAAHMEARYQLYRVADASTHTADIGHGRFVDFAELRQVRYEDNSRWVAIVRHAPNCASCGAGQHSTAGPVCERCAGAAAPEAAGAGGTGAAGASESQASAGAGADAAGGGASSGGGGGGSALASVFMPQKKRPRLESEKGPDGRQADGWGVHLGMLLHYRSPQWAPGAKVAAFDFDNTLARGGFQIQSQPRAQPNFKTVFERLRRLVDAGYVLVIFSNQTSLGRSEAAKKKRNNINDPAETAVMTQKKKRFMSFVQQSKLPWRMFLAMGDLSTGTYYTLHKDPRYEFL